MTLMALPKFILVKSTSNNKYLRYRKENDEKHAHLEFSQDENEENAEIQYVKFEVENSKTMEGFVHIRSCYNNKYWVRKAEDSKWIAAEANEAEEDPSKWCCTLFKAVWRGGDEEEEQELRVEAGVEVDHLPRIRKKPQFIRLVHIDQVGERACSVSNTNDLVIDDSRAVDEDAIFMAYDASWFVILPQRLSFVGGNGKYLVRLSSAGSQGFRPLQFSGTGIDSPGAVHFPTRLNIPNEVWFQNTVRDEFGIQGHWSNRHGFSNFVGVGNMISFFIPLWLGANQLLLSPHNEPGSFANQRSIGWSSNFDGTDALVISPTTINQSSILSCVEPVSFRQVRNVSYNLQDSRVYNITNVQKYRDRRSNNTSIEQEGTFNVTYETSKTMSWEDSITVARSISASMSASIPFVGISFGVELSSSQETTFVWGNQVTTTETVSYGQTVRIPPGKSVTLTIVGHRAQCTVPFSCDVHEIISDGEIRNYRKNDGFYSGADEFNFEADWLEQDL